MKLYLVRHGETELNKKGVYYGWTDCGLTKQGEIQGDNLGKFFEKIPLDYIYSSSLKRAVLTAEKIRKSRDIPLIKWDCFREIHFGNWEGKLFSEVEKEDKANYLEWCHDWQNFQIPKGEAFSEFYTRVIQGMKKMLQERAEETILLVAHNGVLNCIFCELIGTGPKGFWKFQCDQDSYSLFELTDGNVIVKKINESV